MFGICSVLYIYSCSSAFSQSSRPLLQYIISSRIQKAAPASRESPAFILLPVASVSQFSQLHAPREEIDRGERDRDKERGGEGEKENIV